MLVLADPKSKDEDAVYRDLAERYRDIAASLRTAADRMSAQRDLPMDAHDESKWTDEHLKALRRSWTSKGRSRLRNERPELRYPVAW